jgi:2',3'-cyclic-nucleotide 2'-phosphodiesterase (5'-nucleotidase family)
MNTRRHRKLWSGLPGLASAFVLVSVVGGVRADTYRADVDLTNKDIGVKQVPLGDLVADAVRAAGKTDAAFVQASAFSDTIVSLPRAGFGLPDALKSLEYKGDTIGIVKLTGVQIRGALENSLYQHPSRNGAFLQVSGLTVNYNSSAAAGKRVTSVKIGGATLQPDKTYRVAMPLPLANGALAYFKYWKKTDIEKETGISLETALANYLSEHKTIAKGEDRLVATNK